MALELLLARSQMAAVAIGSATAYRTGLEFTVELRLREDRQDIGFGGRRGSTVGAGVVNFQTTCFG